MGIARPTRTAAEGFGRVTGTAQKKTESPRPRMTHRHAVARLSPSGSFVSVRELSVTRSRTVRSSARTRETAAKGLWWRHSRLCALSFFFRTGKSLRSDTRYITDRVVPSGHTVHSRRSRPYVHSLSLTLSQSLSLSHSLVPESTVQTQHADQRETGPIPSPPPWLRYVAYDRRLGVLSRKQNFGKFSGERFWNWKSIRKVTEYVMIFTFLKCYYILDTSFCISSCTELSFKIIFTANLYYYYTREKNLKYTV